MTRSSAGRGRWPVSASMVLALLLLGGSPVAAVEVAEREAVNPGLGRAPEAVDRSSPEATWRSYVNAAAAGRFGEAAHCLDLSEVPEGQQARVGSDVARQLWAVLESAGRTAPEVPEAPGQELVREDNVSVPARFPLGGEEVEIWLRRTLDASTGETVWLVTRRTVSSVADWHRTLTGGVEAPVEALNEGLGPAPDDLDRGSPREAVESYLLACRDGRFDLAAHVLDLASVPAPEQPRVGPRLARRLKIVLDRTFWVNLETLSNDPGGIPEAGLEPDRERLTVIDTDGQAVDVLLSRHLLAGGDRAWTFSATTVAAVDRLYAVHGSGWIGDRLPPVFFGLRAFEVELWQWCGILLLLGAAWVVARLVVRPLLAVMRRATARTSVDWDDELVSAQRRPLRPVVMVAFLAVTVPMLHLAAPAERVANLLLELAAIMAAGWLLSAWVGVGASAIEQTAAADRNQVARSFAPILSRIVRVALWAVVMVVALDAAGVKVGALVAGLGISGLAVAFAAQKTIENLFGSFAIAADRPFEVGDWVTIGGVSGSVEQVGLRSTRVRTLSRTLVTIPNAQVMAERVECFAVRDRMVFQATVGLLYDSTAEQIEFVLDEVKKLLVGHPRVWPDVVRVRLDSFGDSAINVSVLAWVATTDLNEYTAVREELHLQILRIVRDSGSGFAFPSRTVYMAKDSGLEREKAAEVARVVADRRTRGELWVPEPPPNVDPQGAG